MTKEAENASQVILCSLEEWLCHSSGQIKKRVRDRSKMSGNFLEIKNMKKPFGELEVIKGHLSFCKRGGSGFL